MTINEIAKLAGVSRATVSRYLNNGYVSDEKKEILKRVIEETGYVPSIQAQTLRTKKTKIIGVIIPRLNSDAVSKMISGVSSVAEKENYQLLLANTSNDEKKEIECLKTFKDNFVDGIVLMGTVFTKEHKQILDAIHIPVVILSQCVESFSCVYNDDYNGFRELTNLLLRKKKKIGMISVTEGDKAAGLARKNGYKAALIENDVNENVDRIEYSKFTIEDGYFACKKLMEKCPDTEGIVCATDNIAIGATKYLREIGKKIPEEVMVAGVGNHNICSVVEPNLTSLQLYYERCGQEAVRLLLQIINGEQEGIKKIKIGYNLVERGSTAI